MSELARILADTVERLFADDARLERAEAGEWPDRLWGALESNGLTRPTVAEEAGGAGASWADTFTIITAAGRACAPVPLPETIAAAWLLAALGLEVPPGPIALGGIPLAGPALRLDRAAGGWRVDGELERVAWGAAAAHVAALVRDRDALHLVLLARAAGEAAPAANIAGEPRDRLRFRRAPVLGAAAVPDRFTDDPVRRLGAAVRSAQMAGAAARVLDETLQYASDRVQFGRPLARFQAIQHYLATLASRVAQATAGAQSAFRALDRHGRGEGLAGAEFEIASAKVVVGEAALAATSVGHQVHGAIGFTREHALHFATRRLWAWRAEFGAEAYWAERIGRGVVARGGAAVWPDITARQAPG